jgi:MFS family permease
MSDMTAVTAAAPAPSVAAPPPMGAFWRLWTANGTSNLGDGLYQFALPLLALEISRAPSLVAGVTLMLTLAWPVFGLHAGSIVDRFDRRRVLVGVAVLRLVTLGGLTIALGAGALTLPMLYLAALALGVGETLADTALTALVPSTVPPERLAWANGRIAAGQSITNSFVGPPLAGALLAVGGALVTGAATALYGVAALVLVGLRPARDAAATPRDPAGRPPVRWAVTEGLRFLWRERLLRRLTLFTAAMNFWWATFAALFVIFAVAPGPLGLAPAGYGLLVVAMAIGGIAGSLMADRVARTIGVRNALLLDLVGTALLVGVPALTREPAIVALSNVVAGAGAGIWVVLVGTLRQRITPNELLGRVYSASRLVSWGILPVGAAVGGLAAEAFGIQAVFVAGGLVSLAVLGAFLLTVSRQDLARA